jgi:cell fate (sporulation/competence/biofilm development) regulator YmcA (YheA/YmcA/DUF963 family)
MRYIQVMKLKFFIFLVFFFSTSFGSAQSFSKIDQRAIKVPRKISKDLSTLTDFLIHDYTTDLEKVRSFYTWIAYHIKYDNTAYTRDRKRINRSNADVLDRGQAVCFGYATLFKSMCEIANIPCEIVYGYPKNQINNVVDLSTANHVWNAVLVDEKWRLLDITWGSGNDKAQFEHYFLTPADKMIYSHLPADPMWQLLDCPVSPRTFQKGESYINAHLLSVEKCFNYRDSINALLQLPSLERNLKEAFNSYQFNPIVENKKELGHSYMDIVSTLNNRAEQLELTDSIDAIKAVHLQIIATCKIAEKYIELYDHQKENLAYSHFNYGVALSKEIKNKKDPKLVLEEMLYHFRIAKEMMEQLPKNILLENGLLQITAYIDWVQEY